MAPIGSDAELLERFARRRDQTAFKEIVTRHAGLVYAAAVRQVGRPLAEDVSQAVFFILSQKAHQVDGRTLAGWLVNATRFAAKASQRIELRCKAREQKAALMNDRFNGTAIVSDKPDDSSSIAERLAPLLDDALMQLGEKDRSAVILRYLQGKSVREVATAMSISEAAAGKRATRAIKALRDYFDRRGVRVTTESLGGALAVQGAIALPLDLTGKLTATAGASTAVLSSTAATLVQGTLPLMVTAKAPIAAAVGITLLVLGGAVAAAAQLGLFHSPQAKQKSVDVPLHAIEVPPPVPPAPSTPGSINRYKTPANAQAVFSGRVEGLLDPEFAEVGVVYLRGVQWTSTANYQWQPINADGTFSITADKFPEAERALAVRAAGQSVTFLPTEFANDESARDIVVKMKPVRPLRITARNSRGDAMRAFKVEIFDQSVATQAYQHDDRGRPLRSQRLEAPTTGSGAIEVVVPSEPVTLLVSGDGIAPDLQTIDPRTVDHYEFTVKAATPIDVRVTDGGVAVSGVRVMLNNPAVALSYTARTTDADGKFKVIAGIPGTYNIAVGRKRMQVTLVEGQPLHVDVELQDLPPKEPPITPATNPTSQPATTSTL